MLDILIFAALWLAMAAAAYFWWKDARQREAREVGAALAKERARKAALEREWHLARHREFNLNRQLAKAKANKKRHLDLKAERDKARDQAIAARRAFFGEAA